MKREFVFEVLGLMVWRHKALLVCRRSQHTFFHIIRMTLLHSVCAHAHEFSSHVL